MAHGVARVPHPIAGSRSRGRTAGICCARHAGCAGYARGASVLLRGAALRASTARVLAAAAGLDARVALRAGSCTSQSVVLARTPPACLLRAARDARVARVRVLSELLRAASRAAHRGRAMRERARVLIERLRARSTRARRAPAACAARAAWHAAECCCMRSTCGARVPDGTAGRTLRAPLATACAVASMPLASAVCFARAAHATRAARPCCCFGALRCARALHASCDRC